MFSTVSVVLCVTLLDSAVNVRCAVDPPAADQEDLATTEWVIRNTLNNLFSTLKNKDMHQKLKLKQYTTIHNFFASITLQDHDNLKEIARLTKVDNFDNGTRVFITQLNEVLDENNKNDEETDAVYITSLIGEFLTKLDQLKETHGLKNKTNFFDINKAIIKYFENNENGNDMDYTTYLRQENKTQKAKDNTTSAELWDPLQLNESQSGRRIFGGHTVKIQRFPFMASVHFFKKFQCASSIIKSDMVITSASCLQLAWNNRFFNENPAFLSLQVGSTFSEFGGENIPVLEIHFHPNYNPNTLGHNLALLRMVRTLAFGKHIKKVKKIEIDKHASPLPSNTDGITIVGWGARGLNTYVENPIKNKLTYAVLDFYPLKDCQEIYSRQFVTSQNFCAGFISKGGGACNRDAGGPGIAGGILVGVVSFGSPTCGAPDAPTVFTKVGFYNDWIERIMEQDVPSGKARTTRLPVKRLPTIKLPFTQEHMSKNHYIKPINQYSDESEEVKVTDEESNSTRTGREKFQGFLATIFDSDELTDPSSNDQQLEIEDTKTSEINIKKKTKKKKLVHVSSTANTREVKMQLNLSPTIVSTTHIADKIDKTSDGKLDSPYEILTSKKFSAPHYSQSDTAEDDSSDGDYSDKGSENIDVNSGDKVESDNQQTIEKIIETLVDDIDINEILGFDEILLENNDTHTKDKGKTTKLVDANSYLDMTKKRVNYFGVDSKDQSETEYYDTSYENDEESENENHSDTELTISFVNTNFNHNNVNKIPIHDDKYGDGEDVTIEKAKHINVNNENVNNMYMTDKKKKRNQKIGITRKEGNLTYRTDKHKKTHRKDTLDKPTAKYADDENKKRNSQAIFKYLKNLVSAIKNKEYQVNKKGLPKINILKNRKHRVQYKSKGNETTHVKKMKKQMSKKDVDDEDITKKNKNINKKKEYVISTKDAVLRKKKQIIDNHYEVMKRKTTATYYNDNRANEGDNNSDNNKNKKPVAKETAKQAKNKLEFSDSETQYKEVNSVSEKESGIEQENYNENEYDDENRNGDDVETDSNDSTDIETKKIKKINIKNKSQEKSNEDDSDNASREAEEILKKNTKKNNRRQKNNKKKGIRVRTENLFKMLAASDDIYKLLSRH
ncbi:hypothetical protein HF086_010186 [Spodoptera exigua]|uniref:Peptidase S1 domain-containing protein n=1 Tax=Spodoptera exigua TaxID=7107 RepID=A0A922MYX4_SPOEX|nr:hypothetical protein HF086_010186 [Spodoptera exigua]